MAYKTMQQLITDTERAIYQSAGSAVQIYSQDIIMQHLQDAFNHVFDKNWWPRFLTRETLALDGVTGQTTIDPTTIKQPNDIRFVYHEQARDPLRVLTMNLNVASLGSGGIPRFMQYTSDSKLMKVYPIDATGSVVLVGRTRPDPFIITDTVPFDDQLLRHYAAWSYFTDDGSNPSSAAKHQGLFDNRLKMIEDSEYNQPVALDPYAVMIPNQWMESSP